MFNIETVANFIGYDGDGKGKISIGIAGLNESDRDRTGTGTGTENRTLSSENYVCELYAGSG